MPAEPARPAPSAAPPAAGVHAASPVGPASPVAPAPPAAPASPVESVDRALLVLGALADAGPRGAVLAELTTTLGLNKTTLHRALAALRFRDFVTQDPATGAYLLGAGAARLGSAAVEDDHLAVLVHPALVALCREADELVHLGVLRGPEVVYLDKVEPERPVRVWSAIGRRRPAVTTALGRAMLAHRGATRDVVEAYARSVAVGGGGRGGDGGRDAATTGGPDVGAVWAVVERARAEGYATEVEENEAGISCVAVPLLREGSAVAAVSVTAPAERMTPERVGELRRIMRSTLPALLPAGLSLP